MLRNKSGSIYPDMHGGDTAGPVMNPDIRKPGLDNESVVEGNPNPRNDSSNLVSD
ncbi:MAG: hypothetical protein RQ722_02805 [Desulfuromonadales bacterium]|nr:hypothetical protein [Desulfuromonadales bacterium]